MEQDEACRVHMASTWRQSLCSGVRAVTVEPVLLLFMFASFLTFAAFMPLAYDKSCLFLFNTSQCSELSNYTFAKLHKDLEDEVQTLSSYWTMMSNVVMTIPATLTLLLLIGPLGDRFGRRLPVVVPCLGGALYSVSNIVNSVYMDWWPHYLMIGPVLSGLGGSYLAMLMACYTYLTHLSEPDSRMKRVGVAEASTYIAGAVSVFVSGLLVDTLGYAPVFGIALACQSAALAYAIFFLPDIRPERGHPDPNERSDAGRSCCQVTCLNPLRDMWAFLSAQRDFFDKVHLILFIVVLDILQLATTGENDVLYLFLVRSPRSFSKTKYGYFSGAQNFTRAVAVLLLLPLLKTFTQLRDTTLIMAGIVSKVAGLVVLGLAKEQWLVFIVVALGALQGFPSAGLRASMANFVNKGEQGRLFSVVAATEGVVTLVSTLLFNSLYPASLSFHDGLCFHVAAVLVAACFFLVCWQHFDLKRGVNLSKPLQSAVSEESEVNSVETCTSSVLNDEASSRVASKM
ncbi:hypothetical protein C0Q70_03295 [Pomacea canaliculata]|uniref:Major facilitator superfamily (MFS) profile domain-containing protein n=1 Tax=Pomacea canaliculata TaxID=400727 RepID=A0A2T7PSC1_POMCA|nr:proton-coupled folate transporter-like [Pomacea canaliculata]PVD36316.1 hypothetical protein C0Q70_03295 [Pomacea canaliculata]